MKRQRARLPRARHSSSSADVWWISSTASVSRAVISPSSNQRRAMPVVTITTFQVGVSGVASRSRFTTPTLRGARRIVWAIERIARVFPVPVPATMPNPCSEAARRSMSAPCSRASRVSMFRPNASSIVSQAARVGAMTTTRPVAGSAAWAVVITYDEDGYVKDDDAAKIDYGDLLKKMQQGIRDENDERKRAGYPAVELVGWAEPPRYDSASHKLYWAKSLRFGDDTAH